MKPKTQSKVAITLMLMIVVAAMIVWPYKQQASLIVLGGVAVFSSVWFIVRMLHLRCGKDWMSSTSRREILFGIILASMLLLGSISATLFKELELIDQDMTKRIAGVLIGVMLICMGNYMPKKLTQQSGSCGCGTRKSASLQRFMGWIFVLAGLLYAGVWMLLDLNKTSFATMLTFPVAVAIIVIVRLVYLRMNKPTDAIGSVRHD
tara:strand:- start:320085 stop:320702 length:618 start_codon:yes stop_codon:yes gene_type:complete